MEAVQSLLSVHDLFQGVRPAWVSEVKAIKNRLHIDLDPGDLKAEVALLLALGARPAHVGQGDVPWVVLAYREGNEFCVLQPHNSLID
jgi:hypothetical protein